MERLTDYLFSTRMLIFFAIALTLTAIGLDKMRATPESSARFEAAVQQCMAKSVGAQEDMEMRCRNHAVETVIAHHRD